MPTLDLYLFKASPPCRTVWMLLKHLDVKFNLKELKPADIGKAEFKKVNPLQSVPVLVDNDFTLTECAAIMLYVSETVAEGAAGQALYPPADTRLRATIHSRLAYDGTQLFREIREFMRPQLFQKLPPDEKKHKLVTERLRQVEAMVAAGGGYCCGAALTLADFAFLSSLTYLDLVDYDLAPHPALRDYIARLKADIPSYDHCSQGLHAWKKVLQQQQQKNATTAPAAAAAATADDAKENK